MPEPRPEPRCESWNDLPLPKLYAHLAESGLVRRLLELARDEDLGPESRDLTAEALGDSPSPATVHLAARQNGVLAGLAAVPDLLEVFGSRVSCTPLARDGDRFTAGDRLATFAGPLADLVRLERTLLNLTGRLCGVATRTAEFLAAMDPDAHPRTRLYDTRKTTPGLRVLEKYAVRCGGGFCHRLGLHDAVMFKDNHIAGVPSDRLADHAAALIGRVHARARETGVRPAFIEFEVDTLDQLDALLTVPGIDVILLDNMPPVELVEAVARRDRAGSPTLLEASGGVRLETIAALAETGVDRISVGGLTHQATGIDLGFDAG